MDVLGHDAQSQVRDHSSKNSSSALRAGVRRIAHALDVILEIGVAAHGHDNVSEGQAASRLRDARHFGQGARRISHVMKRVAAGDNSRGAGRKGQRVNIGAHEFDIHDAVARGLDSRLFHHRRSQVRADRMADARSERARECPGPAEQHRLRAACPHGSETRGGVLREAQPFFDARAAHGLGKRIGSFSKAFANFFVVLRIGIHAQRAYILFYFLFASAAFR